ncbi:MAG: UvrD-helicase domain-containing protein, partial [Zwartia sp.]
MSEKQPSDSHIRRQATDPRHSFLVQAPAGSGKTELLTDRILALLSTVKRPEEIIAITFTRKAAAEMHERVLEKLTKGLSDIPPVPEHERRSWEMARKALERDR